MTTQVNPTPATIQSSGRAVVAVGVDGSPRNRAAVARAHQEAAAAGGELVLVGGASHPYDATTRPFIAEYASARAALLGVPLVAVHAWQLPASFAWSPEDVFRWGKEAAEQTSAVLVPCAQRHPDVEVITVEKDSNAAMAVLDAAGSAQLIVLGRHTSPDHLGGLPSRLDHEAVLHHAQCPVAVIPTRTDDDSRTGLAPARPWAARRC